MLQIDNWCASLMFFHVCCNLPIDKRTRGLAFVCILVCSMFVCVINLHLKPRMSINLGVTCPPNDGMHLARHLRSPSLIGGRTNSVHSQNRNNRKTSATAAANQQEKSVINKITISK